MPDMPVILGVAAGDHVELLINQVDGAVTEKGMFIHYQDLDFCRVPCPDDHAVGVSVCVCFWDVHNGERCIAASGIL